MKNMEEVTEKALSAFDGKTLTVNNGGDKYEVEVNILGWYELEKLSAKHVKIEQDSTKPNKTGITIDYAELNLDQLKKGVTALKKNGEVVTLTPETLKSFPVLVKDELIKIIAPNQKAEREKLKNLERS